MRSTPIYEVHAIKYAHLPRKAWEVQIQPDPHDGDHPMDYFVWVAKNAHRAVVIDIGFTESSGGKRGRKLLRCPIESLKLVGVDPVPYTPSNGALVRFRVKRPYTLALYAVDWEEDLGVGTEKGNVNNKQASPTFYQGDGGVIAWFSNRALPLF